MTKRFILASSSATRQRFFRQFPHPVEVIASNYDEDMHQDLPPEQLAISLSQGKARAVAKGQPDAVVLGIDTFMVFQGRLIGKPHTEAQARRTLQEISGQTHLAISGFTIIDTPSGQEVSGVSTAQVTFRNLSGEEIDEYVATGEPLDKAGAYASQQRGSLFIEKIKGDFYTLSGVPIAKISPLLAKFGVHLLRADDR